MRRGEGIKHALTMPEIPILTSSSNPLLYKYEHSDYPKTHLLLSILSRGTLH